MLRSENKGSRSIEPSARQSFGPSAPWSTHVQPYRIMTDCSFVPLNSGLLHKFWRLAVTCSAMSSNHSFPDPAMTFAAIDRIIHHATIIECNTESYRRRIATKNRDPETACAKI